MGRGKARSMSVSEEKAKNSLQIFTLSVVFAPQIIAISQAIRRNPR
jgi:hypothetical protein